MGIIKRYKNTEFERKQGIQILMVTVFVVVFFVVFISYTIRSVDETVTQSCFDNLAMASEGLGEDLVKASNEDQAVLSAIANVIEGEGEMDKEQLTMFLNCYDLSASYLSYVELLFPDNTMLDAEGTVRDVSSQLDFEEEAKKGRSVSNVETSTKDGESKVVRNSVPVVKNGKTVYILYGTISLDDLAKKFDVNIYNGDAYIFLEDGDTGDFIIDTWHDTLGNIEDFKNRKLLDGFTWENAISDMQKGKNGRLSLVSNTINEVIYLYYAPVGINNWNVLVMTPQKVALAESQTIRNKLYLMAGVIGVVLILYMVYITTLLFKSYKKVQKIGLEDQNTGLLNRNAFDIYVKECQEKKFPRITCVYIDVNGLHAINNKYGHAAGDYMLKVVSDSLKKNFRGAAVYRVGGDEFVVFSESAEDVIQEKMDKAIEYIEAHNYSISYGIVTCEKEIGLDKVTNKADEVMLEYKEQYYLTHDRRR